MDPLELAINAMVNERAVLDLNEPPCMPSESTDFDAGCCCCMSADSLVQPIMYLKRDGTRVKPGGVFVSTFSDRCFPLKAIRGWLAGS